MYHGFTESQENIEARKRRILQYFSGIESEQTISELSEAAKAYIEADHSTPETSLQALGALRTVYAKHLAKEQ